MNVKVAALSFAVLIGAQAAPQEQAIDLGRPTGLLSGTLLLPQNVTDKVPVVLIIGPLSVSSQAALAPPTPRLSSRSKQVRS